MFIEIDVSSGENCAESLQLMFNGLGEPTSISRVRAPGPDGVEVEWEVTGWSAEGPCPPSASLVEESGEGTALLVFGGDEGIRLKPAGSPEPWDLASPSQWGEPCLLLNTDAKLA